VSSAVLLDGVSKRYSQLSESPTLIGRATAALKRTRAADFWALRDINLDLAPGERLAVIGRNGAGKSTMLRILAGVTAPTDGSVTVRGRIAPLLSVGVGFHPQLTGRENVFVNGTMLGLSHREVQAKFDEIVEFAGIAHFLDTPVKFYSSGMFVRLGFAVAVVATPDVLIVDEVLAVGDVAFQQKSFAKMKEVADRGTTVLVVSHNLAGIRQMCDRTMLLHQGEMLFDGRTEDAITRYYGLLGEGATQPDEAPLVAHGLALVSPEQPVRSGSPATFRLDLEARESVGPYVIWMGIGTPGLAPVYTEVLDVGREGIHAGTRLHVDLDVPLPMPTGDYVLQVAVRDPAQRAPILRAGPLPFRVEGPADVDGLVDLGACFTVADSA